MASKKNYNIFRPHFDIRYVFLIALMALPTFGIGIICGNARPITTDSIHIFGRNNFPPYQFINKNGQPAGFDVDVIKTAHLKFSRDVFIS